MVGIPRSKGGAEIHNYEYANSLTSIKGCRICVQRRVKCDQSLPHCKNCLKGNRPCPGYDPVVKFQDEGPRLREKHAAKEPNKLIDSNARHDDDNELPLLSLSPGSEQVQSPVTPNTDSEASLRFFNPTGWFLTLGFLEGVTKVPSDSELKSHVANFKVRDNDHELLRNLLEHSSTATTPPPVSHIASPSIMQIQLLQGFCDIMAPRKQNFLPMAMQNHGLWLRALSKISGSDTLLDTAIRAVTIVHIGRLHHHDTYINESRQFYGRALRLLNKAIMDPVAAMDNKTLCATILLSYYEMFASDTDASWIRHAGGAGTLMRMRGPERHRRGLGRDIFLAYRYILVIEAFQMDMPCFLNDPEWRKLSHDIHKDIETAKLIPGDRLGIFHSAEHFYEHLAEMSQSFANVHQISSKGHEIQADGNTYLSHTYRKLRKDRQRLKYVHSEIEDALQQLDCSPSSIEIDDPIIPIRYSYINVFVASIYAGFWTILYNCNSLIIEINANLKTGQDESLNEAEVLELQKENRETSLNSCRSADYMLQSSFIGPFFAIFALRSACHAFQIGEPEWNWTVAKLIEIGDRHMTFARHIPWFVKSGGGKEDLDAAVARARSLSTRYKT